MAATGACFIAGGFLPMFGRDMKSIAGGLRTNFLVSIRPSAVFTEQTPAPGVTERGRFKKMSEADMISKHFDNSDVAKLEQRSLKDYFEQSKDLIRSDGGPPRWFSPLECGSRLDSSPLLLFLPGFCLICSFFFYLGKFFCSKYFIRNRVLFFSVLWLGYQREATTFNNCMWLIG